METKKTRILMGTEHHKIMHFENGRRFAGLRPSALARWGALLLGWLLLAAPMHGQDAVDVLKTGRFWTVVTENGSLGPVDFSSTWFPADFNAVGQETNQGSATTGVTYLATTDWEGPDGTVYEKAVVGLQSPFNTSGTIVEPQQSYVRYGYPSNVVSGQQLRPDPIGEEAPNQITDLVGSAAQLVTVTNEYALGVEAERKIFAWGQRAHNNYVVTDITYTNVSDQTLTDFWIYMTMALMGGGYDKAFGTNPEVDRVGDVNDHWAHYYGAQPSDSQRVYYAYHADDPRVDGDNMGNPSFAYGGYLVDFQIPFFGFLHVSEAPYEDPANDENSPLQPRVTFTGKGSVIGLPEPRSRYGGPIDNEVWYDGVTREAAQPLAPDAPEGTYHQINSDEVGSADFTDVSEAVVFSGSPPAEHATIGPYTFEPGESIRVVYVSGVAGLDPKTAIEVGKKLEAGTLEAPPSLPDPKTGYFPDNFQFPAGATQQDIYKDLWLSTGIDSVHKTMAHAEWNYNHDWSVPHAPQPPSMNVKGFPDNTTITFSAPEAEADPGFAGYRIMRRRGRLDTVLAQQIARLQPGDLEGTGEHTYEDSNVQFGASYQYYVQAGVRVSEDNLDALPSQRGEVLWSARTLLPTPLSVEPPRAGSETLSDVTIAPNPYNINDPDVISQGWTDQRGIVFFNLPAQCEINIYTESGDHVQQIVHDSSVEAGSLRWDMITESDQVIQSGVYIATFTSEEGEVAYRKFVVAR